MIRLRVLFWLALVAVAAPATAQTRESLNLFAADARLAFPGYKQTESVGTALGVDKLALPTRGLGLVFGAHLYPFRKGVVTLGLGGELMFSQRSRTQEATTSGGAAGPTVRTKFSALSPQISVNFGSKQGWSYLSAGLGSGHFTTELVAQPVPDGGAVKIINYGGGARWFVNQHVAVSLDLRFYAVNSQDASLGRPAYPSMTILAINAGIGLK